MGSQNHFGEYFCVKVRIGILYEDMYYLKSLFEHTFWNGKSRALP